MTWDEPLLANSRFQTQDIWYQSRVLANCAIYTNKISHAPVNIHPVKLPASMAQDRGGGIQPAEGGAGQREHKGVSASVP